MMKELLDFFAETIGGLEEPELRLGGTLLGALNTFLLRCALAALYMVFVLGQEAPNDHSWYALSNLH